MFTPLDFLFYGLLGALCGFVGVFSESNRITARVLFGAMGMGAVLFIFCLLLLSGAFPDYNSMAVCAGMLLATFREYIYIPIGRLASKIIYDILYIIIQKIVEKI